MARVDDRAEAAVGEPRSEELKVSTDRSHDDEPLFLG